MKKAICVHGHFYQPPRENPWLEEVELQDSAYPYHDWNSKITSECYAPNAASRILDSDRRIIDIVNNYSRMSFNFGPTLLSWMQAHEPEAYHAVISADKASLDRFSGHGAALAQCYNHMIMPLASMADKRTQVIWGIRDFQSRFKRQPEGMWLPETAVDLETLDILAEYGIRFTILAPSQAKRVRARGQKQWEDVSGGRIDPRRPYLCTLESGRTITIFFYDGPVSHDIAFGDLLSNGERFAQRLRGAFSQEDPGTQLVHVATDGETYGHHHRFGEMALAYCLYLVTSSADEALTVYGEYLAQNPAEWDVEIVENSAWSCFHGIERWRNDCGCNSGAHPRWQQKWRLPLRQALDWLRDNLSRIFEEHAAAIIRDPWAARDDYIRVILDRSEENVESFLKEHAFKELSADDKIKALRLFEMQRHAMLMFTSCGWFFDEISGIETVQIMQYAARAIQLAREVSSVSLEEAFMSLLERAPSNLTEYKNGKGIYEQLIQPSILDPLRVGVHYAVSSLFREYEETAQIYSFTTRSLSFEITEIGKQRMAIGVVDVRSRITREEEIINFVVLHFGDQNLIGAAKPYADQDGFAAMKKDFKEVFGKGEIPEIVRLVEQHFNHQGYSLWHLFRDEQRAVIRGLFNSAIEEAATMFRQVFEHHAGVMQVVDKLKIPPPRVFASVAEFILNTDIREAILQEEIDLKKLKAAVSQIRRFSLRLDRPTINYVVSTRINNLMASFAQQPDNQALLRTAREILESVEMLSLELNLWKAQNIYFSMSKQMQKDQLNDDFLKLAAYLRVKV